MLYYALAAWTLVHTLAYFRYVSGRGLVDKAAYIAFGSAVSYFLYSIM